MKCWRNSKNSLKTMKLSNPAAKTKFLESKMKFCKLFRFQNEFRRLKENIKFLQIQIPHSRANLFQR